MKDILAIPIAIALMLLTAILAIKVVVALPFLIVAGLASVTVYQAVTDLILWVIRRSKAVA